MSNATDPPSIEEFISARLDEDEEWARSVEAAEQSAGDEFVLFVRRWLPAGFGRKHPDPWPLPSDPARVLREVAAKRRALSRYLNDDDVVMWPVVEAIAAVYSDHSDYREDWDS